MALMTLIFQMCFKTYFILALRSLLVGAAPEQGSLYMWIDARQARILLGKKNNNNKIILIIIIKWHFIVPEL